MRLGNGRWESTQFNSRLQPTQIALGGSAGNTNLLRLDYTYNTPNVADNNGNVLSQTITVNRSNQSPLVFNQTYTYDSLNRLKSAVEMTGTTENWRQTYTFDRYGNRRFDQANTTQPNSFANPNTTNPQIDSANNRFTTGQGWTYDLAGNVITDAEGRGFNYDAENKQVTTTNSSTATLGTYYFDGDGKRVKKVVPNGETTIFVYDAGGKTVAEYSTVVQPTSEAKTQYLTNDNLGTPRINTDQLGNVVSRSDYMPYGEEIISLGGRSANDKYVADDVRQGFTGYENDAETGLDYAQARMYAKNLGRFTGADRLLSSGKLPEPQTWNRYVYTNNSPLINVDPLGLYICSSKDKDFCSKFDAALQRGQENLSKIADKYGKDSKQYDKASRALAVYGEKGVNNGVFVVGKDGSGAGRTDVQGFKVAKTESNPDGQKIVVGFDISAGDHQSFTGVIAHEGSHAADGSDWVASGFKDAANPTNYETELKGYMVQSLFAEARGSTASSVDTDVDFSKMKGKYDRYLAWPYSAEIWNSSWAAADVETLRKTAIDHHLKYDKQYKMTPTNPRGVEKAFGKGHRAL